MGPGHAGQIRRQGRTGSACGGDSAGDLAGAGKVAR
jgi:hypothetical protein